MLSHLYRLMASFHRTHGYYPNALTLNAGHYQCLQSSLPRWRGRSELARFLGMVIVVSPEVMHPTVSWRCHAQPSRQAHG